ncbi:hypothetical protein LDELB18P2_0844 [Lactobacillus delbrueckii]|nr:hypothetical protein LDELB18P2_0844 [Lactobacillus delbrueckii]
MRGEYIFSLLLHPIFLGSPPLAWGILLLFVQAFFKKRITPTCVGNTLLTLFIIASFWDHPHLRGEYKLSGNEFAGFMGSPPLAWGILIVLDSKDLARRITPTCVGNTRFHQRLLQFLKDHPHLRGEYLDQAFAGVLRSGSPPLAWGIPYPQHLLASLAWITPTCVGNTHSTKNI